MYRSAHKKRCSVTLALGAVTVGLQNFGSKCDNNIHLLSMQLWATSYAPGFLFCCCLLGTVSFHHGCCHWPVLLQIDRSSNVPALCSLHQVDKVEQKGFLHPLQRGVSNGKDDKT